MYSKQFLEKSLNSIRESIECGLGDDDKFRVLYFEYNTEHETVKINYVSQERGLSTYDPDNDINLNSEIYEKYAVCKCVKDKINFYEDSDPQSIESPEPKNNAEYTRNYILAKAIVLSSNKILGALVVDSNVDLSQKTASKRNLRRVIIELAEQYAIIAENQFLYGSPIKMKIIKIFLASSSELREDRDQFDLYIRQQNDALIHKGIYLRIVRWEKFLDAMSSTGLQDEYNKEVRDCDIFVSLFFTKTGKYTEIEFNTAHQQFLSTKKPIIYTFFKNADIKSGDVSDEFFTLISFKKKLSKLKHFHTQYNEIEHLKRQFKDQLEMLLK